MITGDSLAEIQKMKLLLDEKFKVIDLGDLEIFLGMEVAQSKKEIALDQCKYIINLLQDSGMLFVSVFKINDSV